MGFPFKIILNVLVSSFRFILIPMLLVCQSLTCYSVVSNFQSPEVVDRGSEAQLQVTERDVRF